MGQKDNLFDYYLRAAGVASIWIDEDGQYRGGRCRNQRAVQVAPGAIARKLEEMASGLLIGLTKHVTAVERTDASVAAVELAFEKMAASGGMRE